MPKTCYKCNGDGYGEYCFCCGGRGELDTDDELLKNFQDIVDAAFEDDGDHDPLRKLYPEQITEIKNRLINAYKLRL